MASSQSFYLYLNNGLFLLFGIGICVFGIIMLWPNKACDIQQTAVDFDLHGVLVRIKQFHVYDLSTFMLFVVLVNAVNLWLMVSNGKTVFALAAPVFVVCAHFWCAMYFIGVNSMFMVTGDADGMGMAMFLVLVFLCSCWHRMKNPQIYGTPNGSNSDGRQWGGHFRGVMLGWGAFVMVVFAFGLSFSILLTHKDVESCCKLYSERQRVENSEDMKCFETSSDCQPVMGLYCGPKGFEVNGSVEAGKALELACMSEVDNLIFMMPCWLLQIGYVGMWLGLAAVLNVKAKEVLAAEGPGFETLRGP